MSTFNFRRKPVCQAVSALALSAVALTPHFAFAAERATLEEIVVTATRRAERQQDVAIPMTAVTGDMLERAFAQDLRDLTNQSPNVQLEPVGIFQNSASFFIRGQGTGDIESAADSKVGIYVDGVVQARVSTALSDMLDVQAVEILRGPQGTLFGRNTIAGAVQLLHNEPEMNRWGAEAAVQIGDFGRRDLKGIVNIPLLDDTLAARVAIKDTHHDGYWKNSAKDNEDAGGTDRLTVLPSLKWTPNENLAVVLRGEWNRTRDDTYMSAPDHYCRDDPFTLFTGTGSGPGGFPDNDLVITTQTLFNLIVLGQDPVTAAAGAAEICAKPIERLSVSQEYTAPNTADRGQKANVDVGGITAQVDYDLPDLGTVTYIGNYRKVDEDIIFGIDASFHDLFAGQRIQEHDQMSHEIRFASNFSDRFDFVAGAYYFEQEYTMKQESWGLLFAPNIVLGPTLGFAGDVSFTSPVTQGQAGFSNQKNDAWALFTHANWHLNDQLTLTVGGRYTSETKDFSHCAVGSGNPLRSVGDGTNACNNVPAFVVDFAAPLVPGTPTPLFQLMPAIGFDSSGGAEAGCRPVLDPTGGPITCNNKLGPVDKTWTQFSPMAGLRYRFSDDIMGFFTYTAGFTAGGFNGRAGSVTTLGPFDPETADTFEIGVKSDWLENRLRVNANAFMTSIEDFQTAFIRPAPNGGGQETIQSNLGKLETKGVEVEVQALPMESLTLWGAISWLDTERKGFCTDPDGPSGTDPLNPPTVGGPFSQDLPVCGPAQRIDDVVGNFVGWLVPNDLARLNPTGRSPEWTYAAGFAYEWRLDQIGSVTLHGDWQHQGKQTIAGSRVNELPGVVQFNGDLISHFREASDVFNASLIWRSKADRYQASFFVKNLTNELFVQAVTNVGGLTEIRVPNIRRHWGLELRANFGG
jgi:iron complex outermembrane recepter protein